MNEQRLRISGIHHITLICKEVERSVDFYRNPDWTSGTSPVDSVALFSGYLTYRS